MTNGNGTMVKESQGDGRRQDVIDDKDNGLNRDDEVKWTDAQIRWTDGVGASSFVDDKEKEESGYVDPFVDPDPTETFEFQFPTMDEGETINISIEGYKTQSDQVWQSTGLTLWKASTYLCDYMVQHASELCHKQILELGAGLGLNGILAHCLAPTSSTVFVTDGDTNTLLPLRNNIRRNRCADGRIFASQLLWGKDTAHSFLKSIRHSERESGNSHGETNTANKFDIILASDVVYASVVIDPLWETIQTLLNLTGQFWMAFAKRRVPVTVEYLLQKATQYGFRYELVAEMTVESNKHITEDTATHTNPDIEDAAGAEEVYIYVFEWDDST